MIPPPPTLITDLLLYSKKKLILRKHQIIPLSPWTMLGVRGHILLKLRKPRQSHIYRCELACTCKSPAKKKIEKGYVTKPGIHIRLRFMCNFKLRKLKSLWGRQTLIFQGVPHPLLRKLSLHWKLRGSLSLLLDDIFGIQTETLNVLGKN